MSWQAVARKEFRDAIRSRWLHGSTLFFALFIGGAAALFFGVLIGPGNRQVSSLFGFFANLGVFSFSFPGLLALVLGFIALSTSYGSITGERETGSIKLLLSLPNSRLDAIIGKFLGRSAVVVAALLVGFLVTFVVLIATGTRLELGSFVPQVALTALLGMAFVSIGLGISALAGSNREATLATMGLYLVFAVLWGSVSEGVPKLSNYAAEQVGAGGVSELTRVKIGVFLKYLNPLKAYETLAAQLYYGAAQARLVSATFREQNALGPVLQESVPLYFSGWFLFGILLAWIVVPVVVGYWAFDRDDL
ncbi:copper ABC transporter permease [Halobellus salinus]|uniref:Copper ABC transporter permease n=1 Tax=Halobellus salinus TaxID=931585 RepID=A0A830EQR1_9EURY|nr:ABC transporter permease [Halobellus salinus]GGJ12390.1 copper ABC transporter permease [Halobellus salinus]SMP29030.1 ABC-2 type transport system permease protein [Halobellus salinus]